MHATVELQAHQEVALGCKAINSNDRKQTHRAAAAKSSHRPTFFLPRISSMRTARCEIHLQQRRKQNSPYDQSTFFVTLIPAHSRHGSAAYRTMTLSELVRKFSFRGRRSSAPLQGSSYLILVTNVQCWMQLSAALCVCVRFYWLLNRRSDVVGSRARLEKGSCGL